MWGLGTGICLYNGRHGQGEGHDHGSLARKLPKLRPWSLPLWTSDFAGTPDSCTRTFSSCLAGSHTFKVKLCSLSVLMPQTSYPSGHVSQQANTARGWGGCQGEDLSAPVGEMGKLSFPLQPRVQETLQCCFFIFF